MSDESTLLACPECRGQRFSWYVKQVQFGSVHQLENGHFSEEASKMGPITGSDVPENGVHCVDCGEDRAREDLVPVDRPTTEAN